MTDKKRQEATRSASAPTPLSARAAEHLSALSLRHGLYMQPDALCRELDISLRTAERLVARGQVRSIKLHKNKPGKRLIETRSVAEYIASLELTT